MSGTPTWDAMSVELDARFTRCLSELSDNPRIRVLDVRYGVRPYAADASDVADYRLTVGRLAGRPLSNRFLSCFLGNTYSVAWEASAPATGSSEIVRGELCIAELRRESFWRAAPDDTSASAPVPVGSPFDSHYFSGDGVAACFEISDDEPRIWMLEADMGWAPASVDYREYLELALLTRGAYVPGSSTWQHAVTREPSAALGRRMKDLSDRLAECFPGDDFSPLTKRASRPRKPRTRRV